MLALPAGIKLMVLKTVMFFFAAGVSAAEPAPSPPAPNAEKPDFADKVVLIQARDCNTLLRGVKVTTIGARTFFKGTVTHLGLPQQPKSPFTGMTVWISSEKVEQIFEFASLEDARKKVQESIQNAAPAPVSMLPALSPASGRYYPAPAPPPPPSVPLPPSPRN
jgi:hypothetical protein